VGKADKFIDFLLRAMLRGMKRGGGGPMGKQEGIPRRNLNNQEYFKFRQATEKVSEALNKRLAGHLEVLRPLFHPRLLLGTYIKSAVMEEVPRAEKVFADLQELYASVCERPFGLPRKLQPPLPSLVNQLEATPFQFSKEVAGTGDKPVRITSPTRWILSYRNDCPLNRLRGMISGTDPRQPEEMRQTLLSHLILFLFLKYFPSLTQLLEDLRYQVEKKELSDLGGLPVITLKAPVETFLPPDEFILQITQLSGIAAFQEIIEPTAIENVPDSLKESLRSYLA
jgi:hypothetical protein